MPAQGGRPGYCLWVYHCRTYRSCPKNEQMYAFMDEFDCGVTPKAGWRLVKGWVCTDTWRAVIGQEPTRFFPP